MARSILGGNDFYHPHHRILFEAVQALVTESQPVDLVTLQAALKNAGALDRLGGPAGLVGFFEVVPTASNVETYCQIVADKAQHRRLMAAARNILALSPDSPIEEIIEQTQAQISSALERRNVEQAVSAYELMREGYEDLVTRAEKEAPPAPGISTGFEALDQMVVRFEPGDLAILGARPSMGKTAMALQICEAVAFGGGRPLFVSLEMGRKAQGTRLLAGRSGVDAQKIRKGEVTLTSEWELLHQAVVDYEMRGGLAYRLVFPGRCSLNTLRAIIQLAFIRYQISLVVVDYLQLVKVPAAKTSEQEISEVSGALKEISQELQIPTLALSQLNRNVEARGSPAPSLHDLRGSGSLEQDADTVLFLYRRTSGRPEDLRSARVVVAKHRQGERGEVSLSFNPQTMRFS